MTIKVCIGSACHIKGSYGIISRLQSLIEQNGLSEQVQIQAVFCLGTAWARFPSRLTKRRSKRSHWTRWMHSSKKIYRRGLQRCCIRS